MSMSKGTQPESLIDRSSISMQSDNTGSYAQGQQPDLNNTIAPVSLSAPLTASLKPQAMQMAQSPVMPRAVNRGYGVSGAAQRARRAAMNMTAPVIPQQPQEPQQASQAPEQSPIPQPDNGMLMGHVTPTWGDNPPWLSTLETGGSPIAGGAPTQSPQDQYAQNAQNIFGTDQTPMGPGRPQQFDEYGNNITDPYSGPVFNTPFGPELNAMWGKGSNLNPNLIIDAIGGPGQPQPANNGQYI